MSTFHPPLVYRGSSSSSYTVSVYRDSKSTRMAGNRNNISIHRLIKQKKWDDIKGLLLAVTDGKHYAVQRNNSHRTKGEGNYPLHAVLDHCTLEGTMTQDCSNIVKMLVNHYPEALQIPDDDGDLPIHAITKLGSDSNDEDSVKVDMFQFLAKKCPSSLKVRNNDGYLPMHNLANECNQATYIAMEDLVQLYPECLKLKDGDGDLLIHILLANERSCDLNFLRSVLELSGPVSIKCQNNAGLLPLHCALNSYSGNGDTDETKIIQYLIDLYPDSLKVPETNRGDLPIHHFVTGEEFLKGNEGAKIDIFEFLARRYPESLGIQNYNGDIPINLYSYECSKKICASIHMLVTTYPATARLTDGAGDIPLHILLANCRYFDSQLVKFLIKKYPKSLQVFDKSSDLPIHIAIKSKTVPDESIKWLFQQYRDCAKIANGEKRLPVHEAFFQGERRIKIARLLLQAVPDSANVKDVYKKVPIDYARGKISPPDPSGRNRKPKNNNGKIQPSPKGELQMNGSKSASNPNIPHWFAAKENDTPKMIAQMFGVDCQALVEGNRQYWPDIKASSKLKKGTEIRISQFESQLPTNAHAGKNPRRKSAKKAAAKGCIPKNHSPTKVQFFSETKEEELKEARLQARQKNTAYKKKLKELQDEIDSLRDGNNGNGNPKELQDENDALRNKNRELQDENESLKNNKEVKKLQDEIESLKNFIMKNNSRSSNSNNNNNNNNRIKESHKGSRGTNDLGPTQQPTNTSTKLQQRYEILKDLYRKARKSELNLISNLFDSSKTSSSSSSLSDGCGLEETISILPIDGLKLIGKSLKDRLDTLKAFLEPNSKRSTSQMLLGFLLNDQGNSFSKDELVDCILDIQTELVELENSFFINEIDDVDIDNFFSDDCVIDIDGDNTTATSTAAAAAAAAPVAAPDEVPSFSFLDAISPVAFSNQVESTNNRKRSASPASQSELEESNDRKRAALPAYQIMNRSSWNP